MVDYLFLGDLRRRSSAARGQDHKFVVMQTPCIDDMPHAASQVCGKCDLMHTNIGQLFFSFFPLLTAFEAVSVPVYLRSKWQETAREWQEELI